MGKTCVICGKPSGMYPLCREHLEMKANGEVVKCEDCGIWHIVGKPCKCKKKLKQDNKYEEEQNDVIVIDNNNKSKCITCGKKTDGLLFCPQCFHKYKNKELYVKITNCTNVELVDSDYEGRFTCKDGHIVKSKSERDIDNYLFEHGIFHAYEKELPYGGGNNEVLHPDFYLPNYLGAGKDVYIEHWGYNENNLQYTKTKKFKMPIYEKLGITLVCTYEKADSGNIDSALNRKLNPKFIKQGKINYEEKQNHKNSDI